MPYPPKPPRKHPELTVAEARRQHLTPYQFKAGEPQPNNPRGMTKAQRQQYLEAKGLLHQAGPLAILRLVRLTGIDLETNTLIPDDQLPDPRVVLIAAQNLAERVYGRPKEMERPVAAETVEIPGNRFSALLGSPGACLGHSEDEAAVKIFRSKNFPSKNFPRTGKIWASCDPSRGTVLSGRCPGASP